MIPKKLKGTEFEAEVLHVIKQSDELCGGRYGVMLSYQDDQLRPIKSYPDIEGIVRGGVQFVVECKVCSAASLSLASLMKHNKSRKQLKHLLDRAEFNAITGYLIHFNERVLKTKTVPAVTYMFPVHPLCPYWMKFEDGIEKSIKLKTCEQYGFRVHWGISPRCRKPRPNIEKAIVDLDNALYQWR